MREYAEDLLHALQASQEAGAAGEDPVEQLHHSRRFLRAISAAGAPKDGRFVDLGSGGGIPGLPLAMWLPGSRWLLVEARLRRAELLAGHVRSLAISDRVSVDGRRAEEIARDPELRGTADVVVARAFGGPAETAECATGLLREGGCLLVSEPPDSLGERWAADPLAELGMRREGVTDGVMVIRQSAGTPEKWPRRSGMPRKRPLF